MVIILVLRGNYWCNFCGEVNDFLQRKIKVPLRNL